MRPDTLFRAEYDAKYLDAFVTWKCAPDLLALRVFPNAKEITEAISPWNVCRKVLGEPRFGEESVNVYCVGDGVTPRAGAVFAFRSRWRVWSIDPGMRLSPRFDVVKRLTLVPKTVEDFIAQDLAGVPEADLHVIVAMHSHGQIAGLWNALPKPLEGRLQRLAIACPCCKDLGAGMPREPRRMWTDRGIWSPQRTVLTWSEGLDRKQK